MKKGLYIVCVICMLHCVKLIAYADEGFSKFLDDIDIPKIECESYDIPSYSGFKSFMSLDYLIKKLHSISYSNQHIQMNTDSDE